MLDDVLIINRIKEGDVHVFERVFRCYYSPLWLYATSITGRTDVAEEIIQELFYVLWRDRKELRILTSIKNYLYGAVRNQSLQYCEHLEVRNRHKSKVLSGEIELFAFSPQEQLEYNELDELIKSELKKMPERRLRVFQLHRIQGLKYVEIAETLSLSVKTVEAEMTKALKTLRKVIENYTRI